MKIELAEIVHNQEITQTSNPKFWFEYQRGILLALKELGLLNETQSRSAEEILRNQCRLILEEQHD